MDTTVKRIRPADYELSTVQDNLAASLQQVLDFINKNGNAATGGASPQLTLSPLLQSVRGPGTPQSIQTPALLVHGDPSNSGQNVVTIGDPATATASAIGAQVGITGAVNIIGAVSIQGDTNVRGNTVFFNRAGNGFIITPPVAGPAFYVTNIGGSTATFIVNDDGSASSVKSISAPTFISNSGFKSVICLGEFWHTSAVANTAYQLQKAVVNTATGGNGLTPWAFKPPQPGSIVGLSLNQAGPVTGTNYLQIYKNGVNYYSWLAGTGGNGACFWTSFGKGILTFNAGDTLTAYHYNTASGNTQVECHATIEMSA